MSVVTTDEKELTAALRPLLERVQRASRDLAALSADHKNAILRAMAASLVSSRAAILSANRGDTEAAAAAGLSPAMVDRLTLNEGRFDSMVRALEDLAALPDPVGETLSVDTRPNGLEIRKVRVPIGVIAIIYEARPNVTVDAAGLCIKTSNAVVLRGGSEARRTNEAIADALERGGEASGLPQGSIALLRNYDRRAVDALVQMEGLVDLVIPRGGEGLIRAVAAAARVPVLKHYKGVCHLFVDASADQDMALSIVENAKCQRPGVCNAVETLLVHSSAAPTFLPKAAARLQALGVELRCDPPSLALISGGSPAEERDWSEEYLDLILAVKVVQGVDEAVEHINRYGSKHTDAIVTASEESAQSFTSRVDSGVVLVNASTRFNDGGEFGFGAEMGISTDKFHARGPVGPRELTTYKYVVRGSGQTRG